MANGNQQNTPNYSDDQISAILQYANPQGGTPSPEEIAAYKGSQGQMLLNSISVGGQPTGSPGSGTTTGGQPIGGILGLLKAFGGGGGQQQNTQPQDPALDRGYVTGTGAMNALGAAALNMGIVRNPTPGQGTMSEGGVNPVQQAQVGTTVPGVPAQYLSTPGVFAPQARAGLPALNQPGAAASLFSPSQWQQFATGGSSYQQGVAQQMGLSQNDLGAFQKLANNALQQQQVASQTQQPKPVFTPTIPGNATSFQAAPPPFGVAPAAPGVSAGQPQWGAAPPAPGAPFDMGAHTSALRNAGMTMYAQMTGGDPNTASPADIDKFHRQLTSHIGDVLGGPPGGSPGAAAGAAATALGTGGGPPPAPGPVKRMAAGGWVTGDDEDQPPRRPRETVHPPIQAPQSASTAQPGTPQATQQNQGSDQGTGQGPAGSGYQQAIQDAIRARAARQPATTPFSTQMPSGTPVQGPNGPIWNAGRGMTTAPSVGPMVVGTPGNYTTNPNATTYQTGVGAGGTGVGTTAKVAGGISTLASGLASAAQAYADSIKPWQVQASHIPDPSSFRQQQPITFSSSALA